MDVINYLMGIGYGNTPPLPWFLAFSVILTAGAIVGHFEAKTPLKDQVESPSANPYLSYILLFIILIVGAGLRFYALDFGLPHTFHPDEVPKVNAVMRMKSEGTLDPQYFLHPSLLLYSTYFVNSVLHYFGAAGDFQDSAFLAGRIVSATCGVLSVLLTFLIARELFSKRIGLFSAAFLAVFPLHVTCSRYLKEDSLLTFLILLSVYLVLYAVRKGDKYFLYLAGLSAGLSASAKYSGALSFCIIGAAPFLRAYVLNRKPLTFERDFVLPSVIAIGFMPIGFLLGTPYSILNMSKFLKDFGYESRHMSKGHTSAISAWSQYWIYYFSRCIAPGATLLSSLAAVFAIGRLLRRLEINGLYLVALFLLFYLPAEWVKAKPAPQPDRYILPCMPFVAILAAIFIDKLRSWNTKLAILLAVILFSFASYRTVSLASYLRNDTREQMTAYIESNLPAGSKVLIDLKAYSARLNEEKFEVKYIGGAKVLEELDLKNLRSSGYDYLLLSSLFYDRYFSQPNVEVLPRERIRNVFKAFSKQYELDVVQARYGFHNPKLTLLKLH